MFKFKLDKNLMSTKYKLLACLREVIVVHIKCTINHVQIQIGQKLEEYKLLACPREVREQLLLLLLF